MARSDSASCGSASTAWDALAEGYDADPYHSDPVMTACILQAVADLRPAGKVLDCGCGPGLTTRRLLGAEQVYALDYSERMLEQLRRKFRPGQVQTACADVRNLPFQAGVFDCVLMANVLQHLSPAGHARAAAEIMRVLKPGGRYAVSVAHYNVWTQRAGWSKEGRPGQRGLDYVFRFTRAELAALFPRARIRAIGFYGRPAQLMTTKLAGHLLARLGHGYMICAYGTA